MLLVLACVVFGLVIGSFLSVCIYRIPLGRESGIDDLLEAENKREPEESAEDSKPVQNIPQFEKPITLSYPPRSFCPHCHQQIAWYHNIPLFGWFMLRGKCANCKTKISFRYPFVELLSAFFCVLSFQLFAPATAVVIFLFCAAMIVLCFIDIDYYLLPDEITFPCMYAGVIVGVINHATGVFQAPIVSSIPECFVGFVSGAAFLVFIAEAFYYLRGKEGLGWGDIKLLAGIGAFFGIEGAFYTIMVGSLIGSLFGILVKIFLPKRKHSYLSFGPLLIIAILLYIFTGPGFMESTLEGLRIAVFGDPS